MGNEVMYIYLCLQVCIMLTLAYFAINNNYYILASVFLIIGALNLLALSIFTYDIWVGR